MKNDYSHNRRSGPWFFPALLTTLILLISSATLSAQSYDNLVFEDNFDGTAVDLSKWTFLFGDGTDVGLPPGWGNNELQWYQEENATVNGGFLTITAKQESPIDPAGSGYSYTSSRMITEGKFDFTYGKIEMRAKMPITQGMWPAFWMFFTGPGDYGGWAASGEIDIMEYIGSKPDEVFGTIHYGQPFPGNVFSSTETTLASGTFNDDFHTFGIEWDPDEIRWFLDGVQYASRDNWWSNGGNFPAPFDKDFHLLLNFAVGGNLPGNPDGTSVFPQEYVIDYVRVWKDDELPTVTITSPGDGAALTAGPLTITADATAPDGVAGVQFLQGDFIVGEDLSAPYELTLPDVGEGPFRIRAMVTDNLGKVNYSDFVEVTVGTAAQGPYTMQIPTLPGTIEVENFDTGGQGIAFNDSDPTLNEGSKVSGNKYRNPDGVDLEETTDTGGGHNIGFVANGEWTEYTVNIPTAGVYDITTRVASQTATGAFNIAFDGVDKTGTVSFPATGGSQVWTDVLKENVALDAGIQIMRLNILANGFNINNITISPADPASGDKVTFDDMEHGNPIGNGWFAFGGSVGGGGIDPNFIDLPPLNGGAVSLQTGWGSGGTPGFFGGFGRTNLVDLSQTTYFNMWINPDAGQDYTLEINLQEDDNNDNVFDNSLDDEFRYNLKVGGTDSEVTPGGGWQLVSIPLSDFFDNNGAPAGNGVLDADLNGNGGLVNVVVVVVSNSGADVTFRTDFWSFTNGPLGPEIDVSPVSHAYGPIGLGGKSSKAFTVRNEGCTDLDITATTISGGNTSEFSILSGAAPFTLTPGAQQVVVVEFMPTSLGLKSTDFIIESNDVDEGSIIIPLTGEGTDDPVINKVVFDDMEHGDPSNNGYFTFVNTPPTIAATSSDLPPENGGAFALDVNQANGGSGGFLGGFGREFPVDLTGMNFFNFWINPDAGQDYTIEIQLQDDDNGDDQVVFQSPDDDEFQFNFTVNASGDAVAGGGWQLISIPLNDFFDDPVFGGNDVLDPIAVANGGNGQLINVIFGFIANGSAAVSFRTDLWCFSEAPLGVTEPDIAVSPETHNFGPVFPGTTASQTFVVLNNGGANLNVSTTSLGGPDAGDFSIVSGGAPFVLGIGESRDVVVEFNPSSNGGKNAVLSISSDDPDQPLVEVPLSGEGSDVNKVVFDDMEHGNPFANGWFAFNGTGGGGLDPNAADLPPANGGSFSLQTGWGGASNTFFGGFGRTNPKDLSQMTHFNFWINPNPGQEYVLEVNLQDDDNGDNAINQPDDDEFQYNLTVGPEDSGAEVISGGGWQLVSIPFEDFFDDGSFLFGGNGVLDPIAAANGGNGQLINVVFAVIGTNTAAEFRTDFWCFSEGELKTKLPFDDFEHGDPITNGWFTFGGSVGGGGIDPNFTDLPPQQGGTASMQTGWGSGGVPGFFGGFGRTNPIHIADVTHFNMWINPDAGQDFVLEINLQDDDNSDNLFPFPAPEDDEWQYNLTVGGLDSEVVSGGGWQLVSIPLEDFFQDTSIHGGNGIFDPVPTGSGGNGQLINIVAAVISNSGADATFRTDFWCFTDGPAELDCDPAFAVDLGEDRTVYSGYEPAETVTLTASVSGANGAVSYLWSTGETTESISVSPTEATTYSVYVFDGTGCNSVDEVTVDVVDVSCKNGKVLVCHNGKKTICIKSEDVADHLAHGDQLGSCGGDLEKEAVEEDDDDEDVMEDPGNTFIKASPNPFSNELEFQFGVANSTTATLEVYNNSGQRIVTLFNGIAEPDTIYEIEWDTNLLREGMYIYKFSTHEFSKSKMIILNR